MAQSRTVKQATKKQEKLDEKQKKDDEKARQKGIKQHVDRQSDPTQERMKQSNKTAKKFNTESKENFFERWANRRKQKSESIKRSRHRRR